MRIIRGCILKFRKQAVLTNWPLCKISPRILLVLISLIGNPGFIENKTVIELGSGVGFTGIGLANDKDVGFKKLRLTDHHPKVISNLKANVEANLEVEAVDHGSISRYKHGGRWVEVASLDWNAFEEMDETFEAVIGADIVFDKSVIPMLAKTIARLFEKGAKDGLVCCCDRNPDTTRYFTQELLKFQDVFSFRVEVAVNPYDLELRVPLNCYFIKNANYK